MGDIFTFAVADTRPRYGLFVYFGLYSVGVLGNILTSAVAVPTLSLNMGTIRESFTLW